MGSVRTQSIVFKANSASVSLRKASNQLGLDLNPRDFFLWGYLKARDYNPLANILFDLKTNLERELKNISKEVLNSTFLDGEKRCKKIIEVDGGHIEDK